MKGTHATALTVLFAAAAALRAMPRPLGPFRPYAIDRTWIFATITSFFRLTLAGFPAMQRLLTFSCSRGIPAATFHGAIAPLTPFQPHAIDGAFGIPAILLLLFFARAASFAISAAAPFARSRTRLTAGAARDRARRPHAPRVPYAARGTRGHIAIFLFFGVAIARGAAVQRFHAWPASIPFAAAASTAAMRPRLPFQPKAIDGTRRETADGGLLLALVLKDEDGFGVGCLV